MAKFFASRWGCEYVNVSRRFGLIDKKDAHQMCRRRHLILQSSGTGFDLFPNKRNCIYNSMYLSVQYTYQRPGIALGRRLFNVSIHFCSVLAALPPSYEEITLAAAGYEFSIRAVNSLNNGRGFDIIDDNGQVHYFRMILNVAKALDKDAPPAVTNVHQRKQLENLVATDGAYKAQVLLGSHPN